MRSSILYTLFGQPLLYCGFDVFKQRLGEFFLFNVVAGEVEFLAEGGAYFLQLFFVLLYDA